MELVVGPLKLRRQDVANEYEILLTHFPNLELVPISREILLKAGEIRAAYNLRNPDALVLATAITGGATLAISNDRAWSRVREIKAACLDDGL